MAIRHRQTLGLGVAGIVVFLGGFAFAATRPDSSPWPSGSGVASNPTASLVAPTPTPWNSDLTTEPVRPRGDGMGGFDVEPRSEIESGRVDRATLAMTATYDAVMDLGVRSSELRVTATIVAHNDDPEPIDRIELNTAAAPLAAMKLGVVSVDGRVVKASVDSQTILVPLGGVLPPGARVRVRLTYTAQVGEASNGRAWLFTRRNGIVELYRWLPWVSRNARFAGTAGDPFVTPTSPNVRVRLRTDRPVIVGASGPQVGGAEQPSRDMTFAASNVRDFNLILSESYDVHERTVDGIVVRLLTETGQLNRARIDELVDAALRTFGSNLGPYPYPELTIAEAAAPVGMESPAMVWIPSVSTSSPLIDVIPHEIAHQWFYALVGNDQISDPFADEAITSFMSRDLMDLLRSPRCDFDTADGTIDDYVDPCYYETVYIRGARLYDSIRDDLGDAVFWAAVRGYVEAHRFGLGSTRELLDALQAATSVNLKPRIEALLPSVY